MVDSLPTFDMLLKTSLLQEIQKFSSKQTRKFFSLKEITFNYFIELKLFNHNRKWFKMIAANQVQNKLIYIMLQWLCLEAVKSFPVVT